ncbi:molybdopterin-dependent oxidoreductase [Streptomyces sp. NBC_00190]|uniref:molybdopterin-dependent oxidoreductase n=1 Tax=unclassified Streptomyces TaxID=2593676 RepID=UPI002E2DF29E|nr:molybdopterin-dependent oxidoreductase [Streptomyces sp. NBC_00190]WSZ43559.1 molybdopterin-dependent oxidoreductase [Streptomyces sp. NBC_00868]
MHGTDTSPLTGVPAISSPAAPALLITGEVRRPIALTVEHLRTRWPQHQAQVVFDCATAGPQRHSFEGPLLREVISAAEPAFDPRRRKDRSRFLLTAEGGDGHHSVLAWAEVDEDFGDAPILLATRMDGRDLDAEGSQLVVPTDRCGARYVSALTRLHIDARPAPAEPRLLDLRHVH